MLIIYITKLLTKERVTEQLYMRLYVDEISTVIPYISKQIFMFHCFEILNYISELLQCCCITYIIYNIFTAEYITVV